jgi:hypothetical protein
MFRVFEKKSLTSKLGREMQWKTKHKRILEKEEEKKIDKKERHKQ